MKTLTQLWQSYVNGELTEEAFRKLLAETTDSYGRLLTPENIGLIVTQANNQKLSGIANARPEVIDPEAGYRRGLTAAGRDTGLGSGELGTYLRDRFNPTFALFGAQGALSGNTGADPRAFEQFAQQTGGRGLGLESQTAFRDLMSRAKQGQGDTSAEGWAALQPWLSPKNPAQRNNVGELAGEAAAGKYGGIASRYFLPSTEDLTRQWETGPTGAQNSTLLEYLRRAFGL